MTYLLSITGYVVIGCLVNLFIYIKDSVNRKRYSYVEYPVWFFLGVVTAWPIIIIVVSIAAFRGKGSKF